MAAEQRLLQQPCVSWTLVCAVHVDHHMHAVNLLRAPAAAERANREIYWFDGCPVCGASMFVAIGPNGT